MKIRIGTNIDAYQTNCFPTNLTHVPEIGTKVEVVIVFRNHFKKMNLPISLEVKDVTHSEDEIYVEVHYSEIDIQIMHNNGINMFS